MISKLIHIISVLAAISIFGQVALYTAVENKEEYRVNQKIIIKFILRIDGNDEIQETPLRLPDFSKFNIIGNGSDTNSYVDIEKKIVINQQVFEYVVAPKQPGKLRIGSALVTVNGRIFKTEPIDIFVKEANKKNEALTSNNDVYLDLEIPNKNVYENQPTKAVLRVYSKDFDNFRKVENISMPHQDNIRIKPVSLAKSEIEPSTLHPDWASQVVAIFMIFPNEPGNIDVAPASASFGFSADSRAKILSNKVRLKVKSLPENSPENYKNAVGNFAVDLSLDDHSKDVELNKPMGVTIRVSGEGNLNSIHIPTLQRSADYDFYRPNISELSSPSNAGVKGMVDAHYIVVPKKQGTIHIATEKFSYFDPSSNKYIDLGTKHITVNVMSAEQLADSKTAFEKVNEITKNVLDKVDTPIIPAQENTINDKKRINWLVIAGNLGLLAAIAFIVLFLRKRYISKKSKALQKPAPKPITTVAETEQELRNKMKSDTSVYMKYLENLLNNSNNKAFFETYGELEEEMDHEAKERGFANTLQFLENEKGSGIAEKYRLLQQKIQIEKFSPIHNHEEMVTIYESIQEVFSPFAK